MITVLPREAIPVKAPHTFRCCIRRKVFVRNDPAKRNLPSANFLAARQSTAMFQLAFGQIDVTTHAADEPSIASLGLGFLDTSPSLLRSERSHHHPLQRLLRDPIRREEPASTSRSIVIYCQRARETSCCRTTWQYSYQLWLVRNICGGRVPVNLSGAC